MRLNPKKMILLQGRHLESAAKRMKVNYIPHIEFSSAAVRGMVCTGIYVDASDAKKFSVKINTDPSKKGTRRKKVNESKKLVSPGEFSKNLIKNSTGRLRGDKQLEFYLKQEFPSITQDELHGLKLFIKENAALKTTELFENLADLSDVVQSYIITCKLDVRLEQNKARRLKLTKLQKETIKETIKKWTKKK